VLASAAEGEIVISRTAPYVLVLASALISACSSACPDLAVICATCTEPNAKSRCDSLVVEDDPNYCESGIEVYDPVCGQ
jgi:hypothetical protein